MIIFRFVLLLLVVSCSPPSGKCVKQTDCAADQVCSYVVEPDAGTCTRPCTNAGVDAPECASESPRTSCGKFVGPPDPDGGAVAGYACNLR